MSEKKTPKDRKCNKCGQVILYITATEIKKHESNCDGRNIKL